MFTHIRTYLHLYDIPYDMIPSPQRSRIQHPRHHGLEDFRIIRGCESYMVATRQCDLCATHGGSNPSSFGLLPRGDPARKWISG